MGLDISSILSNAGSEISQGAQNLESQAQNAGLGYLEQQAINTLQADQAQHNQAVQTAIAQQLASPAAPGSFGAYLSSLAQGPAIKQYGGYAVAAIAVIVVATLLLR